MKGWQWIVAVVALAGSLAAPATRAQDTGAAAVDAAWVKAMKANSIDQIMACYAEDAVGWFPDSPEARGAKAIRATFEGILGAFTVKEAGIADARYHDTGRRSTGWGKFVLIVVEKATGKESVWKGRFTCVAERRHGRWFYIVDHASVEPAAPATDAPAK